MARMLPFKEGDVLIAEGEQDTAAYLIHKGWLQVSRARAAAKRPSAIRLGPGNIVGELGLAGRTPRRTATVTALTDGEVEVIDRGTLIRLVNGPGSRLTPLLSALLSRLQSLLIDQGDDDALDEGKTFATLEGLNPASAQALCNRPCPVTHLPWIFGAHSPPQSVTDLFRDETPPDVVLAESSKLIRLHHLAIEAAEDGGLQLHLMHYGDYCELDEERIVYGKTPAIVALAPGEHTIAFGPPGETYRFRLSVPG